MNSRLLSGLVAALALAATACNSSPSAGPSPAPVPPGTRLVEIAVTNAGFTPASVPAKQGERLMLRFTRTTESECLNAIALPGLDIKRDLPMNTPVDVAVAADKPGKIGFQCWMAMYKGAVDVAGE